MRVSSISSLLLAATSTTMKIMFTVTIFIFIVGVQVVQVESLQLSSLQVRVPTTNSLSVSNQYRHCHQQFSVNSGQQRIQRQTIMPSQYDHDYHYHHHRRVSFRTSSSLQSTGNDNNDNKGDGNDDDGLVLSRVFESIGLVCQPVVWISLYFVATTGGGLPAGPGGSIGAIEGISYLVVAFFALFPSSSDSSTSTSTSTSTTTTTTTTLSRITIALGILILFKLITDQGCIPNAKPILDYSNYLPVCNSNL